MFDNVDGGVRSIDCAVVDATGADGPHRDGAHACMLYCTVRFWE